MVRIVSELHKSLLIGRDEQVDLFNEGRTGELPYGRAGCRVVLIWQETGYAFHRCYSF